MILSQNLNVYLKTTETCNLNCSHCFTSGSQGAKIFFNPQKTIHFFERLKESAPKVNSIRFMFHGGEPLLAPIDTLYEAYYGLKDIFPNTTFGLQTNLVYPLTDVKKKFLKEVLLPFGFGTSWDYDIRFGSTAPQLPDMARKQLQVWENNVRELNMEGHELTMIVSITKRLIQEKEPIEVIQYAMELGFKHILFERITSDGNAKNNSSIIPANAEQDEWLHKMFLQTIKYKLYKGIDNLFLSEISEAYVNHKHIGNRCRNCEQSLLTINADGTIGGCPNTGPVNHWGHIDWSIDESFSSKKRLSLISCERFERNPNCYSCPAFEYCNSDCNKLAWDQENTYCAAPKKVWNQMILDNDINSYKKLILA
jgi:radical SAM protein with 4Fe4S-binding SPASM domain